MHSARRTDEAVARCGDSDDNITDYPSERRSGVLPHATRDRLEGRVAAAPSEADDATIGERAGGFALRSGPPR